MKARCHECGRWLRAGDARTVVNAGSQFGDYLCSDCTYLLDHDGEPMTPGERAMRDERMAARPPQSETLFGREVA